MRGKVGVAYLANESLNERVKITKNGDAKQKHLNMHVASSGTAAARHWLRLHADLIRQTPVFSRIAARRIGIEQPPLSLQIQKLERQVGGLLFERSSRQIRLASLGEALLPEATSLLEQSRRLMTRFSNLAGEKPARCTLALLHPLFSPASHAPSRNESSYIRESSFVCRSFHRLHRRKHCYISGSM